MPNIIDTVPSARRSAAHACGRAAFCSTLRPSRSSRSWPAPSFHRPKAAHRPRWRPATAHTRRTRRRCGLAAHRPAPVYVQRVGVQQRAEAIRLLQSRRESLDAPLDVFRCQVGRWAEIDPEHLDEVPLLPIADDALPEVLAVAVSGTGDRRPDPARAPSCFERRVCPEVVLGRVVWAAVAETVWHRVTSYRTIRELEAARSDSPGRRAETSLQAPPIAQRARRSVA